MVRTTGYEAGLMSAQYYNSAGIFACDEYTVYSNGGVTEVGPLTTTEITTPNSTMGKIGDKGIATDSWLNTGTFLKAWDEVIKDGKWWSSDWTVKVDPDAVFFPERLRDQIAAHTGGLNAKPLWVGNCDRVWHGSTPHLKLFGSIEIFSRNAIGTYKAFGDKCKKHLPWQGWGEDLYMQSCMDMLHVEALNGTSCLGDKRCYDAPCTDVTKVAFHDFKDIDSFFQCWGQSKGSEKVQKKLAAEREVEEAKERKALAEQKKREHAERQQREWEMKQQLEELERKVQEQEAQEAKLRQERQARIDAEEEEKLAVLAKKEKAGKVDITEKEEELFIRK